jgi:hypothetical protein
MDIKARIVNDFGYHPPSSPEIIRKHEDVREVLRAVADHLVDLTVPGREQSLMLTALEEAMFWANGSIARNQ